MTYNVFSWTLNPTQSINLEPGNPRAVTSCIMALIQDNLGELVPEEKSLPIVVDIFQYA